MSWRISTIMCVVVIASAVRRAPRVHWCALRRRAPRRLGATPLTSVSDPRRSSVCGPAGEEAYLRGQREVSPRDIAERVLSLRQDLAKDFIVELEKVPVNNEAILRRALTQSYSEMDSTTSGSE